MSRHLLAHCVFTSFVLAMSVNIVVMDNGVETTLMRRQRADEPKGAPPVAKDKITTNYYNNPCKSCKCSFLGREGTPTSCDLEVNSRAMVQKWVPQDATTLEVGANYGSVSCAIAEKTKQSGKQVSVDADHSVWDSLDKNRVNNKCNFHIVKGLLANYDGRFFSTGVGNLAVGNETSLVGSGVLVPHFTVGQIEFQYGLKFDTGIFDCSGCAAFVLKDFPELKAQLKLIVIEQHDEGEANVIADLLTHGWVMVDRLDGQRVLANKGVEPSTADDSPESPVRWMFEAEDCPTAGMGSSCVDVCKKSNMACDRKAWKIFNDQDRVGEAFMATGHNCTSFQEISVASYWEGPLYDNGLCRYNIHDSGFGLCEGSAACGSRRLCPCVAVPLW